MTYESALLAAADPTRHRILTAVAARARTVGDIALELPVSRPAVSQHLKVLKEAGWVDETRVGTRHFFRVNPATALALRNHFEAMWQQAMHAYATHVIEKETRHGRAHDTRRKSRR
jgi:DNA-binding transcriptional ArsR family regulator